MPPCLVLELASRPLRLVIYANTWDSRTNRNVWKISFLGSNLWRTSAKDNRGVRTNCLYNGYIRKSCSFQRKIFTCEVAYIGLFQNRLLDSAGSRSIGEGKLNVHAHKLVFGCGELGSYVARLSLLD